METIVLISGEAIVPCSDSESNPTIITLQGYWIPTVPAIDTSCTDDLMVEKKSKLKHKPLKESPTLFEVINS